MESGSCEPVGAFEEFMAELSALVRENAPRVFALCEETGDHDNGHIRYWGMAFDDCTEVVNTSGTMRGSFPTPECAHHRLSRRHPLHLVWA